MESGVSRFAAAALTASYAWLLVALLPPFENRLIGPAYSHLRITIPYANIAVVAALVTLLVVRGERTIVLVAGILIILSWFYVRFISFAV